jgi:DNA repair protein RecN (Recombination protein N)
MLTSLSIKGLAIIDSLSISFSPGFNVITGETGAGKSILIRALNLLMGAKANADTIRKGSESAMITGEFLVNRNHPVLIALENLGIPLEESDEGVPIVIRRQITTKGRSQSWVNDIVLTSHPLREIGTSLIDVFGQHENQRLMDAASHTSYVDSFLKDRSLLRQVEQVSRECLDLVRQIESTLHSFHDRQKNRDYVSFRLQALKDFEPTAEDFEALRSLCQRAERSVELRDTLGSALGYLSGGAEGDALARQVKEAAKSLSRAAIAAGTENTPEPSLSLLRDRADALSAELDDLNYELEKLVSDFDVDEAELEQAQERVYGYQDLFRKHSVRDVAELIAEVARLDEELKFLESAASRVEETLKLLADKASQLAKHAADLTRARQKAGASVKKQVESELHELAMPGSIFDVHFAPARRALPALDLSPFGEAIVERWNKLHEQIGNMGDSGAERAQFLLATNPGEPKLPLARIVSGGELSRIMLAFKRALAVDAETCVLVFDEIDTGISGRVADVVGSKMQELASRFQVICISHLPQVAVYADSHFLVKKVGRADRTETSIVRLPAEESAREIARLLSGAEVSTPSLANAKNLIEKARHRKPKRSTEARV